MNGEDRAIVRQIAGGAVGGALAWLSGYLVTYLFYGPRISDDIVSNAVEAWRISGLVFFNAHAVTTEIRQPFDVSTQNFLAADGTAQVLYLLPPIALALAGLFVAHRTEPSHDLTENLRAGATVLFGYLLLSVVGLVVFEAASGETVFRPEPVGAVLIAGVLYPLMFGGLGGLGAAFIRSSS